MRGNPSVTTAIAGNPMSAAPSWAGQRASPLRGSEDLDFLL